MKIIHYFSIALLSVILASCNNKNDGTPSSYKKVTINVKDKFESTDIFYDDCFPDVNLVDGDLRIKIKCGAEIVKAEKVITYSPTLWSDPNDNVYQYEYVSNIEYKESFPLKVEDGRIEFPGDVDKYNSGCKQYFDNVTKNQIIAALDAQKYNAAGKELSARELNVWKRIAQSYKPGELTDNVYEPFDIDVKYIDLVVTFKGEAGEFTKTFRDTPIIGN